MTDAIPSFTDSEQRVWHLRLTIGRAREILETSGFDFANFQDGRAYFELCNDYAKLAQVLWVLVEQQAATHQVSPEDFAELLDGDTIEDAVNALSECLVRFTRRPMRAAVAKIMETSREAQAEGMQKLATWIDQTGRTQMIEQVRDQTTQAIAQSMSGRR